MTAMFGRFTSGLPQIILAVLVCCTLPTAHAVPLQVFGGLPSLEQVALSPDGSRIIFVRTELDTRVAVVVALAEKKVIAVLRLGDSKLRGIQWADNEHVLVKTSETALPFGFAGQAIEWYLLQIWDLKAHTTLQVPRGSFNYLGDEVNNMNTIEGEPMVRQAGGHTVVFVRGRVSPPAISMRRSLAST